MKEPGEARLQIISSLADISAKDWDQIANPDAQSSADSTSGYDYNPFLSHNFLYALEQSGCATNETGWLARHLVLERDNAAGEAGLCGLLPLYLKSHSQGEYVFDHGWADAFERAGGSYYPKLQCAIPFTPATGRRLLTRNDARTDENRTILARGLQQVCQQMEVSSAHLTFMTGDEAQLAGDQGYLLRQDQQFHWLNDDYENFDAFLASLNSRKRKTIRKERRAALADNGIEIEWLSGSDLTEAVWDAFYEFYLDTGSRKWGRPYLNRTFYSLIGERMADDIILIMAKRQGRYIAGAINFIGSTTLYGRHWGCIENHPFLHFEVCYYQAIEWTIAHKKQRIEAGAQGDHKLARGYLPQITRSAHFITNPGFRDAIEDYLKRERRAVAHENEILNEMSPFKKTD